MPAVSTPNRHAYVWALPITITIAVVACLVGGCRGPRVWPRAAVIHAAQITECSGIVASRQHPGVFWVHNDSGDRARIFALDRDAKLLCEVEVEGAQNVDWEDIATDDSGNLYIADTGNNRNNRKDLVVYGVREPDPAAAPLQRVPVQRRIEFFYPEQRAFPDSALNFDCESLFWDAGALYVLTKHRSDTMSALYRLPAASGPALRLGAFESGSMTTAADLSADGRILAVLTYQYLHLFERTANGGYLGRHHRVLIEARQCEAVCFDGQDVLIANEQREVYRLGLQALRRRKTFLPEPPRARIARRTRQVEDWWRAATPLVLSPEQRDGKPPSGLPPEVRLAWDDSVLSCGIAWMPTRPEWPDSSVVLQIMLGHLATAPVLGADDRVYAGVSQGGVIELVQQFPVPTGSAPRWRDDASRFEVQVPLPAAVRRGGRLAFNILVFQPTVGGTHTADAPPAQVRLDEWSWGGSSSTQPLANPLLWGVLTLATRR